MTGFWIFVGLVLAGADINMGLKAIARAIKELKQ